MGILDRIKFDGLHSRDWLVYKYPTDNIKLGSQLIVNEGQVAIFVKGGEMADIFPPGTYTLSTQNLPILNKIINFVYGNSTPFTAEIYFVNLNSKLDLYWGTSDPLQLIDPKYFVKLRIRAFGQLTLKLEDHILFFKEIIGSMKKDDIVRYDKIVDYFRGTIVAHIKTILAKKIIDEKISALEIATEMQNIANDVKKKLTEELNLYGFELINFHIQSINFPDEDFEQINQILKDKARFEIMGDNRYKAQRSFDIYEKAASNSNGVAGAFAAGGIGLGASMEIANSLHQHVSPLTDNSLKICPSCHGNVSKTSKFCNHCGENLVQTKICPQCHEENEEDANFCSSCGTKLANLLCECGNELDSSAKFCDNCGKKIK